MRLPSIRPFYEITPSKPRAPCHTLGRGPFKVHTVRLKCVTDIFTLYVMALEHGCFTSFWAMLVGMIWERRIYRGLYIGV